MTSDPKKQSTSGNSASEAGVSPPHGSIAAALPVQLVVVPQE